MNDGSPLTALGQWLASGYPALALFREAGRVRVRVDAIELTLSFYLRAAQ